MYVFQKITGQIDIVSCFYLKPHNSFYFIYYIRDNCVSVLPLVCGQGGFQPTRNLGVKLNLIKPRGQIMPTTSLLAHPNLKTQRHFWSSTPTGNRKLIFTNFLHHLPCPFHSMVKFIYSEKATKLCEISTLLLSATTWDKCKVENSQNFVTF